MATGTISFDIKADTSSALSAVAQTDKAVKNLGKDAATTAASMTSAAKMEAAAWSDLAAKIATAKMQAQQMQAAQPGGGLFDKLGSLGMASMGMSAIKNSILSVGSAIVKISESTREFDDAVIKLRTGLVVTAEQGRAFADSLQEAWRTGKSSMGELAETARRLSEVMSGEQAVEWTKLLEDYAVQTGVSVDTLGTQLTKALQAGTVSARDLKAMARDGIPVWQLLADTMGVSKDRVMELGKAGSISAADLQKALLKGRDAAQAFNDETAANSLETLSRTGSLAVQKLAAGINKGLRPAIRQLIDSSGELNSSWSNALDAIGTKIGGLIGKLSRLASYVAELFRSPEQEQSEAVSRAISQAAGQGLAMSPARAKQLGFETSPGGSAPAVTADPLAAVRKKEKALAEKLADRDAKLAEAFDANRLAMENARADEASKKLLAAELKALDAKNTQWENSERIRSANEALAEKMERRQRIRDNAAETISADADFERSFIERATPRQLELYRRGQSLGVDMSNPGSAAFKQVMRGFNPDTGKSFVQEDREARISSALGKGLSSRSLSAQGSLRERMAGRVISSHRDDAEQAGKEPYMKPLSEIGKTLTTIADNTAQDTVAVFS